jgi:hypothetical protein
MQMIYMFTSDRRNHQNGNNSKFIYINWIVIMMVRNVMNVFSQSDSRTVPRCDFRVWHHSELHAGKSLTIM